MSSGVRDVWNFIAPGDLGKSLFTWYYDSLPPDDVPITPAAQFADKTVAQRADQLGALDIGDESEKRKRKSAKEKFKIDKELSTGEVGVALGSDPTDTTGVQI